MAISNFNEQLEANLATIAKLTSEKDSLFNENVEKTKTIEQLRAVDLSSSTVGHTAKRPRQHSEDFEGFINNETLLQTMKDLMAPIAHSVKIIEEKQLDLDKLPPATVDNQTLVACIQQELAPFKEILNGLSSNQEQLNRAMENIKNNATTRPTNEQNIINIATTNNDIRNDGRLRPTITPLPLSYAQAVSKSTTPADAIRNITLHGTSEHMELTAGKIRREKLPSDAQITSIKPKGNFNFTFKCKDAKAADIVESTLKTKYGDDITITGVQPVKNQVKITKICTDSTSADEVSTKFCH